MIEVHGLEVRALALHFGVWGVGRLVFWWLHAFSKPEEVQPHLWAEGRVNWAQQVG